MSLSEHERKMILSGDFHLDCPKVEFFPKLTESGRDCYKGSGYISWKGDGYFVIKQYSQQRINISEIFERFNMKSGVLISDEYRYDLLACDLQGRHWKAHGLLLERNGGDDGAVITGKCIHLSYTSSIPIVDGSNSIRVSYSTNIELTCNAIVATEKQVGGKIRNMSATRDAAIFNACGYRIEIEKSENHTLLSASTNDRKFTDNITNTILDSFQFITSSNQAWSIIETYQDKSEKVELQAAPISAARSHVMPPISVQELDYSHFLCLFSKYLEFGLNSGSPEGHPISPLVRRIISSGLSSVETYALTLSVTIESLIKSFLISNDKEVDEDLKNYIKIAIKVITDEPLISADFKLRINGALSNFTKIRAKDCLYRLKDKGLIDAKLVSVYDAMRNKSAHGAGMDWADLQSYLNNCGSMLVLFYHLIFLRVRYAGNYTDYSSYGYPFRPFQSSLSSLEGE